MIALVTVAPPLITKKAKSFEASGIPKALNKPKVLPQPRRKSNRVAC